VAPFERDPLLEILGLTLAKVSGGRGKTTLSFRVDDKQDAHLEVATRAHLTAIAGETDAPSRAFVKGLKKLRGQTVSDVRYRTGESIVIELGAEATLVISLKQGDFAGDVAASLRVPGQDYVNYHSDGMTRLAMRPGGA
jgi:hypothetical protein